MMLRSVVTKVHRGCRSFSGVPTQMEEAKLGVVGWIVSTGVGVCLGSYLGLASSHFLVSRTEYAKKVKELEMAYDALEKQSQEDLKL